MNSRGKSPLQILQSLTQKRFNETKEDKTVFSPSDAFQYKKERDMVYISEIYSVNPRPRPEHSKPSSFDAVSAFSAHIDARNKSPIPVKRPTSKGNHMDKASPGLNIKPPSGLRGTAREKANITNTEHLILDNKTKDLDSNSLARTKVDLACQDYMDEDYNSALHNLTKAENLIENAFNIYEQIPFSTIFLTFHNMIATQYKYNT